MYPTLRHQPGAVRRPRSRPRQRGRARTGHRKTPRRPGSRQWSSGCGMRMGCPFGNNSRCLRCPVLPRQWRLRLPKRVARISPNPLYGTRPARRRDILPRECWKSLPRSQSPGPEMYQRSSRHICLPDTKTSPTGQILAQGPCRKPPSPATRARDPVCCKTFRPGSASSQRLRTRCESHLTPKARRRLLHARDR